MFSRKAFLTILLLSIISVSPLVLGENMNPVSVSAESVSNTFMQASLTQTPNEVTSQQPVLIFAHIQGDFSTVTLSTTITIKLLKDGESQLAPTISASLGLVSVPQAPGWYLMVIPGLPAKTIVEPRFGFPDITWKVESNVFYKLLVDGVEATSDSYVVQEGGAERALPPLITASVYDVLQDPELLLETYGLGSRGWKVGAFKAQKMLIMAVDDKEIADVTFEYSISGGSWEKLPLTEVALMTLVENLISQLDEKIQLMNALLPETLFPIKNPIKIYNTEVPGQPAGRYIEFRATATDINGKSASSPSGFYFVVNEASDTRILIVDPHFKLWLLQKNLNQLLTRLKTNSVYQVPSAIIGEMTLVTKIADIVEKYDVVPFHHWELLGAHYNLYLAWPDSRVADLLQSQAEGGFEPHVILLSNLWLGLDGADPWNWDLKNIQVDGGSLQDRLIAYVKEQHAGLIATHGTLSDWKVWKDAETQYKVGTRGHIGDALTDLNPLDEQTLAALLGLPELALWEIARDAVAKILYAAYPMVGQVAGSLPLQVPRVPFDAPLQITLAGQAHPLLAGIPQEFEITTPSVYNEFGFKSYTQVGWQLAMPRSHAYGAWEQSEVARATAAQLTEKMGNLVENATAGVVSSDEALRIHDALEWGLERLYRSLISANISDGTFTLTLTIPSLEEPITFTLNVDYQKLLQRLPVKLLALSENGLAGIITHDKYWDPKGYRAVYFSFEPEASASATVETLLKNAVEWAKSWEYQDITKLLGDKVRVPTDLAARFEELTSSLPGEVSYSDGSLLNEEGYSTIAVEAAQPATLYIAVAHPSSDKVKIVVLEGDAEVTAAVTTEQTTDVTVSVQGAGTVKLGVSADPESSLNPAYVVVKMKSEEAPTSETTPETTPEATEFGFATILALLGLLVIPFAFRRRRKS